MGISQISKPIVTVLLQKYNHGISHSHNLLPKFITNVITQVIAEIHSMLLPPL